SMGSREQAVKSFLLEHLSAGDRLGLDCRTLSCSEYELLFDALKELGLKLKCSKAAYSAWQAQPLLKTGHAFLLDERYSGKSASEKLFDLRKEMKLLGAKVHVLASLSDIAWLFNLRGDYTQYSPVLLSYAVIEEYEAYLFTDAKALEPSLLYALKELKVEVLPYEAIYSFFSYQKGTLALLSRQSINYELSKAVEKSCEIIDVPNPTIYQKAKKNPIELKNLRKAHIYDGIALTNLIFSLKKELHLFKDEYSVSLRLEQLRKEQEGFVSPSFATIAAYGENAAIVHYQPQAEGSKALLGEGFLLLDSGGHYYLGTTDITRTISLGALSDEQRHLYTLVLKGLLRLSFARFPKETKGYALDVLARSALW
ncbi:MAG TPA: aminopeptidase P family N-terminal domain-containing protein, partial [Clostridia bacterium]|nr:aminopeptidase P family N-terminal domain-containing protein [Clostridia bacterium]